ncbi:DUF421 domain-containing protein [Sphaerotilaceae bacterium SBD11-9]
MYSLFELTVPPWELILRGSAVYWFLFLIFRLVMRRDVGALGLADVLVLVLIADASQNAMAGGYESITDGFILIATIVGWNYALDQAAYRFEAVRRLVEPPPLLLVWRGRVLKSNLAREMMTLDELNAKLREHGVDNPATVRKAFMESDGTVTVIRYRGWQEPQGDS